MGTPTRDAFEALDVRENCVLHTHTELSSTNPNLYLSFIHDAMDHSKTIIPRLTNKVKSLMGQVQPFPLKVVGILNHGHKPGVVAHVSVSGLWPSDPNYTISSIAKQLRDYENYHSGKTRDLAFREPASHELFSALLDEDIFNTTVLRKVGKTRITEEDEFLCTEGACGVDLILTRTPILMSSFHQGKILSPKAQGVRILSKGRFRVSLEITSNTKKRCKRTTDSTTEVYSHDKCLVEYWTRISSILTKVWKEVDGGLLKEGFWPVSDQGTGHISHGYSRDETHVPLTQRQELRMKFKQGKRFLLVKLQKGN
ncbi:hypothetical protein R1sor_010673 [Riccia sorocarpa]|uniref:Uncharacterized protein n=1 Tax=Riccia sorocarpa TaxID=122646 RepID=A0ABD3I2E2_9MARC